MKGARAMFKKLCIVLLVFSMLSLSVHDASALIVHFGNGDQLQGTITSETSDSINFKSDALGDMTINRAAIESIEDPSIKAPPPTDVELKREIEAGYTLSKGNTEKEAYIIKGIYDRKTEEDQITFKGSMAESSSNKQMDDQLWEVSGRYANSFGEEKDWFNSYSTKVDHDKFANIDYRVTPAVGIGYWWKDTPEFKAMTELSLGYEYTKYNNGTASKENVLLIPHGYFEAAIGTATLSEDIVAYPAVDDFEDYRLISTTTLSNPISEALALRISWINEYDAIPAAGAKKHDQTLTASLVYSF
ncbi:YdiY family protein [Candidatus Omnitrophota bacterium]